MNHACGRKKKGNRTMKQYIGTKIVEAEPAYRVDGKVVTLAENRVPLQA